jgi:hypothetical protein
LFKIIYIENNADKNVKSNGEVVKETPKDQTAVNNNINRMVFYILSYI